MPDDAALTAVRDLPLGVPLVSRVTQQAVALTSGLCAAFYASMGFMALAAGLSALRAGVHNSVPKKTAAGYLDSQGISRD